MISPLATLASALADRYRIERRADICPPLQGAGGMATDWPGRADRLTDVLTS